MTACLSFVDNQRRHKIWQKWPSHNSLCRKNPGICRDTSFHCSALNWQAIPAAVLNRFPIESLRIILSSHACLWWMTSLLGDVNEFCVHECTLYRCNNLEITDLEQSASLAMAAIGLHLDNLLSEGSSHFRTAHHLAESVRTGTLGC